MTHKQDKNHLTGKITSIVELTEEDIKTAIINMLNMFKDLKENMNMIRAKLEDIFRKKQMELLEMKNTTKFKIHRMG